MYDDNRESDSILLLRIFEEWVNKFGKELMACSEQSRNFRRDRFARPSQAELQWCKDRFLDFNILKEVAFLSEEI